MGIENLKHTIHLSNQMKHSKKNQCEIQTKNKKASLNFNKFTNLKNLSNKLNTEYWHFKYATHTL